MVDGSPQDGQMVDGAEYGYMEEGAAQSPVAGYEYVNTLALRTYLGNECCAYCDQSVCAALMSVWGCQMEGQEQDGAQYGEPDGAEYGDYGDQYEVAHS